MVQPLSSFNTILFLPYFMYFRDQSEFMDVNNQGPS